MTDTYSTENFTSNFESNQYGLNDESKSESFYSNSNFAEKTERHAFFDKDYDTLVTVLLLLILRV
jgi:hypothetical protein